jgi:hypothetical protein
MWILPLPTPPLLQWSSQVTTSSFFLERSPFPVATSVGFSILRA